jgi:hypothetical protein
VRYVFAGDIHSLNLPRNELFVPLLSFRNQHKANLFNPSYSHRIDAANLKRELARLVSNSVEVATAQHGLHDHSDVALAFFKARSTSAAIAQVSTT